MGFEVSFLNSLFFETLCYDKIRDSGLRFEFLSFGAVSLFLFFFFKYIFF